MFKHSVSLMDWISDTRSPGCTDLQSLVKYLDHRGFLLVLSTVFALGVRGLELLPAYSGYGLSQQSHSGLPHRMVHSTVTMFPSWEDVNCGCATTAKHAYYVRSNFMQVVELCFLQIDREALLLFISKSALLSRCVMLSCARLRSACARLLAACRL